MSVIEIKEYDNLRIACQYQDPDGVPLSITDIDIESNLTTNSGVNRVRLIVERVDDEGGEFILTSDIARLLPRDYHVDIIFINKVARTRVTSTTMTVRVLRSVTIPSEVIA